MIVTGDIVWPPGTEPLRDVTVRVQVEDVTRADAGSHVVGDQVRAGLDLDPTAQPHLPFVVAVGAVDQGADYTVRVHVDIDGTGCVTGGDFVSTQRHPVLTGGWPTNVTVPVRRV